MIYMRSKKEIFGRSIKAGVFITLLIASLVAADGFDIIMDVEGGTISVTFTTSDSPWNNSGMALSETNESDTNQANVQQDGTENINVDCKCSDTAGWTIETAIGSNEFRLECKENAAGAYANLGTIDTLVYSNLAQGENKDFRFKLYMPSGTTVYGPQTATVTFTYSAYT